MSELDTKAIKALLAAASEVPWKAVKADGAWHVMCASGEHVARIEHWDDLTDERDAKFIADAPESIAWLVSQVELYRELTKPPRLDEVEHAGDAVLAWRQFHAMKAENERLRAENRDLLESVRILEAERSQP